MTDLTNKTVEEINALIKLYAPVLEVSGVKEIEKIKILAIIFDVSVNYIKEKHNDLSIDWKAWSVVVVKNTHRKRNFKYVENITTTIDEFITYWKTNYNNYCDNLAIFASEIDRDLGFVYKYLHEKIGSV
jgi:hypothetical protein